MRVTRHACPLCDWHHDEPLNEVPPDALASVFGHSVMTMVAATQRSQRIEEALQKHLSSHKLVEWVQKVSSLQAELDRLKATFV